MYNDIGMCMNNHKLGNTSRRIIHSLSVYFYAPISIFHESVCIIHSQVIYSYASRRARVRSATWTVELTLASIPLPPIEK